jgi:Cu+-exporting ATPase
MNQSANPAMPRHWTIGIGGMTSASCVAHVEKALQKLPGISSASVSLATESAAVDALPEVSQETLRVAIEKAGYEVLETEYPLLIEGMTCASCVARVEKALNKLPGGVSASINLATEQASVHVVQGMTDAGQLIAAVERTGYQAHLAVAETEEQEAAKATAKNRAEAWPTRRRITFHIRPSPGPARTLLPGVPGGASAAETPLAPRTSTARGR